MLKIKKQNDHQLLISNDADVTLLEIGTLAGAHKAIDTLSSVILELRKANESIGANLQDYPEAFSSESVEPLLRDVTMNIPSHITKSIKKSVETSPSHLQGETIKSVLQGIAQVYKDAGEMVMSCTDTTLLSKSLFQKSMLIKRDLELLEEQLNAPLEKIKLVKLEKSMRSQVLSKGIDQGRRLAKLESGYAGIDQDTFDTAKALNKAKGVLKSKKSSLDEAIKSARRLSE